MTWTAAVIRELRELRTAAIEIRDRATAQARGFRSAIGSTGPRPTAGGKPLTDKVLFAFAKKDEATAKRASRSIATIDRKIAALGG
jgi:hypothetical protein